MKAKPGISYVEVIMAMVLVGIIVTPAMSGITQIRKNLDWTERAHEQNVVSRNILDGVINLIEYRGIEYVKQAASKATDGVQLLQDNGVWAEAVEDYGFDILIQEVAPSNVDAEAYVFKNYPETMAITPPIITKDPQQLWQNAYSEPDLDKDIVIDKSLPVSNIFIKNSENYNVDGDRIKIEQASQAVSILVKVKTLENLKLHIENKTQQLVFLDIVYLDQSVLQPQNINYDGNTALVTTTKKDHRRKSYFIVVNLYDEKHQLVKRQGMIL